VLHRPGQRVFEPVVAPEQLAVGGDEARRAKQAEFASLGGLALEGALVVLAAGRLEERLGGQPEAVEDGGSP
jgi:hypothetical protein